MRFAAKHDVTVCLHDEAGRRIGVAKFVGGLWEAPDPEQAAALERVLPGLRVWGVARLSPLGTAAAVEDRSEPEAAPAETPPPTEDDAAGLDPPGVPELRKQAASLGVVVDGRWGQNRLLAEIERAKDAAG